VAGDVAGDAGVAPSGTTFLIWQVLYDSEEMEGQEVVDSTPFMAYREVTCNTMDEEEDTPLEAYSRYVLCPSTFSPGQRSDFRIIVRRPSVLSAALIRRGGLCEGRARSPTGVLTQKGM
jgi:hypothetical protein